MDQFSIEPEMAWIGPVFVKLWYPQKFGCLTRISTGALQANDHAVAHLEDKRDGSIELEMARIGPGVVELQHTKKFGCPIGMPAPDRPNGPMTMPLTYGPRWFHKILCWSESQGSTFRCAPMPGACRSCPRAHKLCAWQGKWIFSLGMYLFFPAVCTSLTQLAQILAGYMKIFAGYVNF